MDESPKPFDALAWSKKLVDSIDLVHLYDRHPICGATPTMTPDRSPDLVVSASTADVAPATLPDATLTVTVAPPCRFCGKSRSEWLTLTEAWDKDRHRAVSLCVYCQLTDTRRPAPQ